jgi:hypothetical protein
MSETSSKKRKLSLPLVLAGGVSSLVLALGMSPTFSAFSASIQNTVDTAGSGTLVMQETNAAGTVTCSSDAAGISTNSATCITIDKYGANLGMIPGQTVTTTINIKNTGSIAANAFSLTPTACGQSANGTSNGSAIDLCSKINVVITSGLKPVYSGTALAFGTTAPIDLLNKLSVSSIAAPSTTPFTFAVTLDSSAGNTYQGLKVLQAMTWAFQS